MTSTQPLAAMTAEFLDVILPTVKDGYLTGAVGHGPHWNTDGKYSHVEFKPFAYRWPTQRDDAVEWIQQWAPTCDVWVCPYLMKTPERKKGNAAWRALLHCDVDTLLDPCKVVDLGGGYVFSGTPGHGHVYVLLEYPVTPAQHETLEKGLVAHMGADPGKISENDLLRPPGTFNHKSPVMSFIMPLES